MNRILIIIFLSPFFGYGQGKYFGGSNDGYGSASTTIESEPTILAITNTPQEITIYPNPTSKTLDLGKRTSSPTTIIDTSGKLISNFKSGIRVIDVSAFPDGIYFLKFRNKFYRFIKK